MSSPVKLSNRQIHALHGALKALDGVRIGKDEQKLFEFDDDTAWAIAMNQVAIEPLIEAFKRVNKQRLKEKDIVDGQTITDANRAKVGEYMDSLDALMEQTIEVDLTQLRRSVLLKKKVLPSIIAALYPIILDDQKSKE